MSDTMFVYRFGNGQADGDRGQKDLLGGKGANLAEMSSIGMPVPPGFTISTEACGYVTEHGMNWPEGMRNQVDEGIAHIEELMDARLGDSENPLLVSVRSGAAVSMPGMMDTVLNLGLSDNVVGGLVEKTNNKRFAYDSYRRFIDMFGDVVMGVAHEYFESAMEEMKSDRGVEHDTELTADDLAELTEQYKKVYEEHTGEAFPQDPRDQLEKAINAVFRSWNSDRAVKYRTISGITGLKGTAVNVQAMVFGNMGKKSATGVCFTRNPSDGRKELYGEFLLNAQGEDVVAGIRTPHPMDDLKDIMPDAYEELSGLTDKLEQHYQNMQDIEFTVQEGKLYILQTRNGKRTGPAAVKIATDMVEEEILSRSRAVATLVEPDHLDQMLHPQLEDDEITGEDILGQGLAASPGAAVGKVVFDPDDAEEAQAEGEPVILVRIETSPEDVGGMSAAEGILTSRGGMTSHAAVVARGWGKPCVAGCDDITIDYDSQSFTNGKVTIQAGDWISLNGSNGKVIRGKKSLVEPRLGDNYHQFMEWVTEFEEMGVRTNADTPEDAQIARDHGAKGIGLTRTEHMFFKEGRINAMRRMIVADDEESRREALDQLLPYQREDFMGIFEAMEGLPVTIRLLDPPLHEFLPDTGEELQKVAGELGIPAAKLKAKVDQLREFNPMLGHRGCRLGITYPEITEMQSRAILEAAVELKRKKVEVFPEIMIPLIGTMEEFLNQRDIVVQVADRVFKEMGEKVEYAVGTMIEIPRAALVSDEIAEHADFFSFGTNDLTQMTFGYSRDDSAKYLPEYIETGILDKDPFQSLDQRGVGQLVEISVKRGRQTDPDLKVGICGEHGGDPASIDFCYRNGLDYVSCSPLRVPIARLAAVQSRLNSESDRVVEQEAG